MALPDTRNEGKKWRIWRLPFKDQSQLGVVLMLQFIIKEWTSGKLLLCAERTASLGGWWEGAHSSYRCRIKITKTLGGPYSVLQILQNEWKILSELLSSFSFLSYLFIGGWRKETSRKKFSFEAQSIEARILSIKHPQFLRSLQSSLPRLLVWSSSPVQSSSWKNQLES